MPDLDPELKKQLIELLTSLLKNAQDAGAWAKTQLPLLVQEKIAFGRAWETALLLATIAVAIFFYKFGTFLIRRADGDEEDGNFVGGVFSLIGCAAVTILSVVQLYDVLMVWFAPRLYIVSWLIELVKETRGK